MSKEVLVGHPPILVTVEDKAPKRTRKGKKSRIAIRKKLQEAKDKESEAARLAREKEEAKREKNTRRNREKKLKQKAKQQAKKASDGAPEGAADEMDGVEATATENQPVGDEST
jgi:predicted ribosome quality control (RQC) complex YloA/Tae2 family protein